MVTIPPRRDLARIAGNDQRLIEALQDLFTIAVASGSEQAQIDALTIQVSTLSGNVSALSATVSAQAVLIAEISTEAFSEMYMSGNASVTTLPGVNSPSKALGSTVAGSIAGFTHSDNRLTYTGDLRTFKVTVNAAFTGTPANDIRITMRRNGLAQTFTGRAVSTDVGAVSVQYLIPMSSTDYIEVWAENETSGDSITVTDFHVIAEAIK